MRIMVSDDGIQLGSMFKLVWVSYVVGTSVVFVPFTILVALVAFGDLLFGPGPFQMEAIVMPFLAPLILAGQGLIIGIIIVFGLAVFRKFARIELRRKDEQRQIPADT